MPNVSEYTDESQWMDDCVSTAIDEGKDQDQAVAMCASMWREKRLKQPVVHKTHISEDGGLEFILSDASVDRYGDTISATGWDLNNFKRNPIALFNHDPNFIVGKWENLRVVGDALRGHLRLAPAGTSARIDEIRKLIEAGILRAVSVGFRPIESKPRSKSAPGEHFVRSELVETSLVAIPANPNALQVAKGLGISARTIGMVFAKHGTDTTHRDGGRNGKHAGTSPVRKNLTMPTPLQQRIEDAQTRIKALRDQLEDHLKTIDDENPDDAQTATTETLTQQIETQEKNLEALQRAENSLARQTVTRASEDNRGTAMDLPRGGRPFAVPAKKVSAFDSVFVRPVAVMLKHHAESGRVPIIDVLKDTYGEDERTRAALGMITRAATVPATTTTAGWAAELVQTAIAEFLEALTPVSIYAGLAAKGATFTFGRNGIVSIPRRDSTPTIAGSFVLQGSPIPVRQGAFSAITMTPKKMAVISTFTREISEHSTPAIEQLIRQAIVDDTAVALDAVLVDANAATTTRPAGMLNGVAALGPTAGGGIAAIIGDLKLMVNALLTSTAGGVRSPVWIMSPGDALTISLTQAAAGGDLPFRDEIARGTLLGFPIIQSTSMTADTIFLVDAADFVTATGDTPNFSVSDQATLHMEDTSPLAIGTAGTPNTVAAPVRSLWQTDTIGIRMIMDVNWAFRRTGMVQWVTGLTWN